jgi:hypothetical protein
VSEHDTFRAIWLISLLLRVVAGTVPLLRCQRHWLRQAAVWVLIGGFLLALYRIAEWLMPRSRAPHASRYCSRTRYWPLHSVSGAVNIISIATNCGAGRSGLVSLSPTQGAGERGGASGPCSLVPAASARRDDWPCRARGRRR